MFEKFKGVITSLLFFIVFFKERSDEFVASDNDLKISLTGNLNTGKTIGEVNKQIKNIINKANLQKIKLNIEIDQKALTTLNKFNQSFEKSNKIVSESNKIIKQEQNVLKKLDGSVEKVTKSFMKNGEIIEKTTRTRKEQAQATINSAKQEQKLNYLGL